LDRATVAACSIQIDDLPLEPRAGEKPTVRKTLTVAARYATLSPTSSHQLIDSQQLSSKRIDEWRA
jgi:hypothetical protein